jgi:hypothetical protein
VFDAWLTYIPCLIKATCRTALTSFNPSLLCTNFRSGHFCCDRMIVMMYIGHMQYVRFSVWNSNTWLWPYFNGLLDLCFKFSWLLVGQFLHCHTTKWYWRIHGSQAYVTGPWPHFYGLLTFYNLQVFVIWSFSP